MPDLRGLGGRLLQLNSGGFPALIGLFGVVLGLGSAALRQTPTGRQTTPAGAAFAKEVAAPIPPGPDGGLLGDAKHGLELMEKFECSRCHDSAQLSAPPKERHCTGCHLEIIEGSFPAPASAISIWQGKIKHLIVVPSLDHTAARFRNDWMVNFLQRPHDLRPELEETMPRLEISASQARDIAAFLAPEVNSDERPLGDGEKGRALYDGKGCAKCHQFGAEAAYAASAQTSLVRRLAPDLKHTRERFLVQNLVAWLRDPNQLAPGTRMPSHQLSGADAKDLAAYLLAAPLNEAASVPPVGAALEIKREVFFEEIEKKVFRTSCWHCHSDPDFSMGDEGPGNEGGFGFAGVGLELASYEGVLGGAYPSGGTVFQSLVERERTAVVDVEHPSSSRLVRALRARQVEERGGEVPGVRGMPLGLPALGDEDIALVQAWIEQGAKW